jgi:ribonucleoside-diphosphate reductase alpha chain
VTKVACHINNEECIAESRYYQNGEDWKGLCERVSSAICANEELEERQSLQLLTFDILYSKKFVPAGRILRNAGKTKRNMLNCFVIPIGDSIESIGDCIRDSLVTWASGGGVGVNFSTLRPVGSDIHGKGGQSSGLVSFMQAMDAVAETIECGGARRSATIAIIDISHPEVEEFIDSKLKHGRLKNFNISVAINNEFLEAVERDADWDLKFGLKVYKTVKARELWKRILNNIVKSAEPGILNYSKLIKDNGYYFQPIIATNPCGELPLPAYGSCDLGSLVLPKFVEAGKTNWEELQRVIHLAVRFLDNVIDLTTFPIKQMQDVAERGRRVGLGVMGLADYLFAKKIRYGSQQAMEEIEYLFRFIRDEAYTASMDLAVQKGAFPKFDPVDYGKASFIKKLPAGLRRGIKKNGIRNSALLTCPPTGTTSMLAGVSSGIEPLFSKAHIRKDRIGDRVIIHPMYEEFIKNGEEVPSWFVDAHDLTPEQHFETQAVIQKYVDGSISKTINLPSGTKVEQIAEWMQEFAYDLKGVTMYVDKSRPEQVLYPMTEKEVIKHLKEK